MGKGWGGEVHVERMLGDGLTGQLDLLARSNREGKGN